MRNQFKKQPILWIVILFVIALTFPVTAGASENVSDYNEPWNGVIKFKSGGKIIEHDMMKRINEAGVRDQFTKEEIGEFFISKVKSLAEGMGSGYGEGYEILTINGQPWQETEYKNLILNSLEGLGNSKFRFYSGLYEFVRDKNYNNRANEVMAWVKAGKTKTEIEGISEGTGTKLDNKNSGSTENENITETEVEVTPGKRVVLQIGNKTISFEKDGIARGYRIDEAPFIRNATTYIPVKGVIDKLGAEINWDADSRTVTITSNKKIEMVPWNKTITIDGNEVQIDNPAIIKNSRTFLPVRIISESLGFKVKWNGKTKEVVVS